MRYDLYIYMSLGAKGLIILNVAQNYNCCYCSYILSRTNHVSHNISVV